MAGVQELGERAVGTLLRADARLARAAGPVPGGPLDPTDHRWTRPLHARWRDVQAELDALLGSGLRLPDTDDVAGTSQGGEGSWTTYVMTWYGRWIDVTCRRCPTTTALVRAVPGVQVAGFTVLGGHSHLPRHTGPARALRYQIGMRVPGPAGAARLEVGDRTHVWAEGAEVLFDDATPHEAWNDADGPRYVFFVQRRLPVGGWREPAHRTTQWAFGRATAGIGRRAERLDRALNPPG